MRQSSLGAEVTYAGRLTRPAGCFAVGLAVAVVLMTAWSTPVQAATPHGLDPGPAPVIAHPAIHNLFASSNVRFEAQINTFTQDLVGSGYLDAAAQYGVQPASYTGYEEPNGDCGPLNNASLDFADVAQWVGCMASWLDEHKGIALGPNNLYMVYLPDGVTVGNIFKHSCDDFAAYHLFISVGIFA